MEYGGRLCFLITVLFTIYHSIIIDSQDTVYNIKAGIVAVCLVFVAQSYLKPYESSFHTWPPDTLCRIISRFGLLYIGMLVYLLFQTAKDARWLFSFIDPDLNQELPTHNENYDRNCEVTYDNVSNIVDFYVGAHFFNWFFAAFIIRDYYVLHFWSLLDELIELTLKPIRPNFAECWWDSLILDLLTMNTFGIYLGMKVIEACPKSLPKFDWLGRTGARSVFEWKVFSEHRRLLGCTLIIVFVALNFVTGFSAVNSLWIPPGHRMLGIRLAIWFTMGAIAAREVYEDVSTWGTPIRKTVTVYAQHRWTLWFMVFAEMAITYKFRFNAGNNLEASINPIVSGIWTACLATVTLYYLYLRYLCPNRLNKDGSLMIKGKMD